MRTALVLRPPAKINLTLRVGPRRPDGFHDIRTLIQSIALSDTLSVTGRNGPLALHVRGHGVPADRENLVWRAADLLWRASGRSGDPRDAYIQLDKAIPAAAGLGGVIAFSVNQRIPEFGVRMALGASRRSLLRLVLGQALTLVAIGLVIGIGLALVSGSVIETLLFGVPVNDVLTYAAVAAGFLAVALLACAVPARRAASVDPMIALRSN